MNKVILFAGFICFVAISISSHAQLNGDWFSFRSFGFAKYRINDSLVIVNSKVDSLHLNSAYIADTFRIAATVKKDSSVYLIVRGKDKKKRKNDRGKY